jgi:zinc transport system substrate-binding protein
MITILIYLLMPLLLLGCSGGGSSRGSETKVVAAFYPLAYAAGQVGGRRVSVTNLTPAGAEPHDLELSPRDLAGVRSADLVLLLGRGFQRQVETAAGHGKNVLLLLDTRGLDLLPNGDPHVWLDPARYRLLVERIAAALHRPAAARPFVRKLELLNRDYQRGLARCARRELVTSHEAFAYLAQRYHLKQVAITGLAPEAEPSPRDLQRVVDTVRRTHATTVYFETLVSPRLAQTVAREAGARTAVLDPIEGLTEPEQAKGENYFTVMRANLRALRRGLGCR